MGGERVALITGAGSGIGRAIALGIAARGARTWIVGRRAEALAETVAQAPKADLCTIAADLTNDTELAHVRDAVRADGDTLNVLVHCAGAITPGSVQEALVADLDAQYQVNLRARFQLTQALLPMLIAGRGDVVFINSTAAWGPRPGVSQYAAIHAAMRSLADSLRAEVNREGVRVLSVFPGRTASPLQRRLHAVEGKSYRPERLVQPADVAAITLAALELPRTAEVTEIALRPLTAPGD